MSNIPKEAKECWFHSCAGHYCVRHSWTEACTYPNCHERDYKGNPYYIHKKPEYDPIEKMEDLLLEKNRKK